MCMCVQVCKEWPMETRRTTAYLAPLHHPTPPQRQPYPYPYPYPHPYHTKPSRHHHWWSVLWMWSTPLNWLTASYENGPWMGVGKRGPGPWTAVWFQPQVSPSPSPSPSPRMRHGCVDGQARLGLMGLMRNKKVRWWKKSEWMISLTEWTTWKEMGFGALWWRRPTRSG